MRFLISATALALLAAPAFAQTTTAPAAAAPAPVAAPLTAAPAQTAAPAAPAAPKKMVGHRQTLKQRFEAANTTRDGHLTKDQATAAKWSYVTKNFDAIDTAKAGYVTSDEISAFAKAHHVAAKKKTTPVAAPASNG
jgi:hypothetical protein